MNVDTFKPSELTAIVELSRAVKEFNEAAPGLCDLTAAVEFERDGRVVARLEIGSGDAANDTRVGHLVFDPTPDEASQREELARVLRGKEHQ